MAINIQTTVAPTPREYDGQVEFSRNPTWYERKSRQIAERIYECETSEELEAYLVQESLLVDGICLNFPDFHAGIAEAIDTQRACLRPRPAAPDTIKQNGQTNMLNIDTAQSASGPFINWKAQRKEFELRVSKDDKSVFTPFHEGGVVCDFENIKIGWQYTSGMQGVAPDWKWWPAPDQQIVKPNDDYKWGMSLPCAIGGGETAVWEQAGVAVQNAIQDLLPELQGGPAGKLPLLKFTGSRALRFNVGSTEVPQFSIANWVDRPDCLKSGFQRMTAQKEETQAAVAAATAAAPASEHVSTGSTF